MWWYSVTLKPFSQAHSRSSRNGTREKPNETATWSAWFLRQHTIAVCRERLWQVPGSLTGGRIPLVTPIIQDGEAGSLSCQMECPCGGRLISVWGKKKVVILPSVPIPKLVSVRRKGDSAVTLSLFPGHTDTGVNIELVNKRFVPLLPMNFP